MDDIATKEPTKPEDLKVKQAELEEQKKSLDIGYVPWGVTSFAELDEAHAAMQKSWNMDTATYQLHVLIDNVMQSPDVENKQAKIVTIMGEFAARVDQVLADNPKKKENGVLSVIKKAMGYDEPEESPNGMTFIKSRDGTYNWVATYSNSFRDDDLFPEIISSKSHKRFVEMVDKGAYPLPELWLWHEKAWKWGAADVVAVDEVSEGVVMALAAGHVDKGKEWIAEALMEAGEILPVSHGMPVSEIARESNEKSVIVQHQTREISPLPHGKEANKLTMFYILNKESNDMAIDANKRNKMAAALGVEPDALLGLEETNTVAAGKATQQGTQFKAKAPPFKKEDEEDDEEDGKKKKEVVEAEAPADNEDKGIEEVTIQELAQLLGVVVKATTEGMAALREEVRQLKEATTPVEDQRKDQMATAASLIYKSIMGDTAEKAGTAAAPASKKKQQAPAGPKQVAAKSSMMMGNKIVPPFIQDMVKKSQSSVLNFNGGGLIVEDFDGEEG
jgi:hypothetical protein